MTRIQIATDFTAYISCYEQFYIWKDQAELLRPLSYWNLTKVFNILCYVGYYKTK